MFSSWTKSNQIYTSLLIFSTRSPFVGWSNKLKVHRANCHTISLYPVRFSTDIVNNNNIFFLLFFFGFFFLFYFFFGFFCFLFLCVWFFCLKQKIYILIHIWLCGRVSDEEIFTRPISGNKTTIFFLALLTKLCSWKKASSSFFGQLFDIEFDC